MFPGWENDLRQIRVLIDRGPDFLEAGATKVHRVYPKRITGNCSHQQRHDTKSTSPSGKTMSATVHRC